MKLRNRYVIRFSTTLIHHIQIKFTKDFTAVVTNKVRKALRLR